MPIEWQGLANMTALCAARAGCGTMVRRTRRCRREGTGRAMKRLPPARRDAYL